MHAVADALLDRRVLFAAFFFGVFAFLVYQLLHVLSPFFGPLLAAIIIALVFAPVQARLIRRGVGPGLAASVSTIVALATIIVPFLLLGWVLIRESVSVVPAVRDWLASQPQWLSSSQPLPMPEPLAELARGLQEIVNRWAVDVRAILADAVRSLGNTITDFGAATVRSLLFVILDLIVLVLALYYFLRDGAGIVDWITDLVPMEAQHKRMIVERLAQTISAIVRGTFITASTQGALTGLGLAVAGVPFPVMLGIAAALLAVVPFVGASLVWLPAAIYLYATGEVVAAVGLFAWGAAVVGLVDNFLRPVVVGERANLPILLLLLAVLGGIQVYGVIGALFAPLLVALFLAFVRIYREQYRSERSS
ncbi:MAG: AI-2E family transporter [Gammaproteobacteria bacterium]